MGGEVDALLDDSQICEGVKESVLEKSRQMLDMMVYQALKQLLGEAVARSHDVFIPMFERQRPPMTG